MPSLLLLTLFLPLSLFSRIEIRRRIHAKTVVFFLPLLTMAMSPEPMSANPMDFRAPPPSPIGTGRRSCVTNDDVLSEFLEHSLRVPDLILPDKIFPRQKFIENPPRIDFQSLRSAESDAISKILDSMASIGCFQLVNHGIPFELVGAVSATAATGVFRVSPEKKIAVTRSQEKPYGFEEYCHGEEESELSEEFVWSRDEGLKLEMEAISPFGYSNFSKKMEELTQQIEKLGEKMLRIFRENSPRKSKLVEEGQAIGSVCCVYKHSQRVECDQWDSSLKYDVIRMLIRGTDFSHALCFHVCNGSSEFHVYSKKGWVSFKPDEGAILVTAGDQIQTWSGGQYKHVIGRPIYRDYREDGISMAFLYSPSSSDIGPHSPNERTISLGHQALLAVLLTLLYNFLVYIFKQA